MIISGYGSEKSAPADRASAGPFDSEEVVEVRPYVDFGAMRVAPRQDVALRLEVEESTKRIIAVSVDHAGSSLQLQAFAAPKSDGLWHEIRGQMIESITSQGGRAEQRVGTLGPELLVQIEPKQGQAGHRHVRFVGVDGPRWFLKGAITGAALTDASAAAAIEEILRSVIIHRGDTPIPPRDLLPLKVPAGTIAPPGVQST